MPQGLHLLWLFYCSAVFHSSATLVKGRIASIEILRVQLLLCPTEGVGETVNMKY